jgi:glycosyltransferase involved in cell wall biosynthesis
MISGAEARRIGRALASVGEWTSEMIVVLNEDVRDGTDRIAVSHGAKVFREAWKGHIAQKNSAMEKAAQPWILGLDADEAVSDKLRDEILALPDSWANFAAYSFPRCTNYFGRWIRHGEWYPDRCTRLWQRGKARWSGIDPHDRLSVEGATGKLRGDLLHYGAETLNKQVAKTVAYADDFARHCQEEGRRVHLADLAVRPVWRFARGYGLKLGFLDGWQGFTIAWMTAFYTFLRYARAREARLAAEGDAASRRDETQYAARH